MSTRRPTPPLSLPVEADVPRAATGLFAGASSADPQPLTDAERLRAQRELQILDTPREDRFARVVRLARRLFGVPMVVVALIEADGRWSTASAGLDAHGGPGGEAFSTAVLQGTTPLVVTDTRIDHRFRNNPLVLGLQRVRFFAGHALEDPSGQRVARCRSWTPSPAR